MKAPTGEAPFRGRGDAHDAVRLLAAPAPGDVGGANGPPADRTRVDVVRAVRPPAQRAHLRMVRAHGALAGRARGDRALRGDACATVDAVAKPAARHALRPGDVSAEA